MCTVSEPAQNWVMCMHGWRGLLWRVNLLLFDEGCRRHLQAKSRLAATRREHRSRSRQPQQRLDVVPPRKTRPTTGRTSCSDVWPTGASAVPRSSCPATPSAETPPTSATTEQLPAFCTDWDCSVYVLYTVTLLLLPYSHTLCSTSVTVAMSLPSNAGTKHLRCYRQRHRPGNGSKKNVWVLCCSDGRHGSDCSTQQLPSQI